MCVSLKQSLHKSVNANTASYEIVDFAFFLLTFQNLSLLKLDV